MLQMFKKVLKCCKNLPERPRSFSAADCCITENKNKLIFKKILVLFLQEGEGCMYC